MENTEPKPIEPTKKESTIVENIMTRTKAEITKNLESGSLVVVTVGDEQYMPTKHDLETVTERMIKVFDQSQNVKVLVVPYMVKINVYSVPDIVKKIEDTPT